MSFIYLFYPAYAV